MEGLELSSLSFNKESINQLKGMDYNNFPIVYILHNKGKKSAYIGQSVQMKNRMKAHLKDPKKKDWIGCS